MTKQAARKIDDIVEEIKDILSLYMANGVARDYDVAAVLRMDSSNLALRKKRNSIPYKEILEFCHRTGINPMRIFYIKEKK